MTEPRLRPDDVAAWSSWMRAASIHSRTQRFTRHLDAARRVIGDALAAVPSWCVMWSGGKDSTAMVHMLAAEGVRVPVASEKDDLDYPGEQAYVEQRGASWGLDLHVLTPPVSPAAWIVEHAADLDPSGDMHSRAAALSKAAFYDVVEAFGASYAGAFLGLRKDESQGRLLNRVTRGPLYWKRPTARHPAGQWIACPLVDWDGLDVYAYIESRGIELLPLYRCISLMHRDEPWRVRKSWWIPGADARWGGAAWLRHYFPSLYCQLCRWIPATSLLA